MKKCENGKHQLSKQPHCRRVNECFWALFVPAVPLILVDLLVYINAHMHIKNLLSIKGKIIFIYWHSYYTWYIRPLV